MANAISTKRKRALMSGAARSEINPILRSPSLKKRLVDLQNIDLFDEENDYRALLSESKIDYKDEINELYWHVLNYQLYSVIIRGQDLIEGAISLLLNQHFISVPLLIRGLLEISAISYDINKKVPTYFQSDEAVDKFELFVYELVASSRLEKDIVKIEKPDTRSILTYMDRLEKAEPFNRWRGAYDVMSEFCHPNYAAPSQFVIDDYNYRKGIKAPSTRYKSTLKFYLECSIDSINLIKTNVHGTYFSIEDYLMKSPGQKGT